MVKNIELLNITLPAKHHRSNPNLFITFKEEMIQNLLHVLIYNLKGRLPWQGIEADDTREHWMPYI